MPKIMLLKSIRDLRKALAQSLALVVISLLGVSSFIALVGAYRDLGTSYNHAYAQLKFADVTYSLSGAPDSVVGQIGQIQGVQAVTGRLIVDAGLSVPAGSSGGATMVRARLIGIPANQHPAVNDVLVEKGSYLNPSDQQSTLVESHFADVYNLQPGATVTPIVNGIPVELNVAGVVASPEYLIVSASRQDAIPSARSFAVLFVPLAEVQSVSGMSGQINDVAVRFSPDADRNATMQRISTLLQPYHVTSTTLRADQPSNAALHLDLAGYKEIAIMMPGLILLVAAASLYVMLGRQIRSQEAQIGLMKALGYRTRSVELHYLTTAVTIALIGGALGILVGIPLERALTSAYATELGIPLVQTKIYVDVLALSLVLSVVAALLGAWGPTRQVARLEPAAAMRPNPSASAVSGRPAFFERFTGLPIWIRMSLRNVLRGRRRTLTTGLGIVFSFMLVMMGWSMIDSMNYVTNRHFNTVERWDQVAVFRSMQPGSMQNSLSSISGVTQVEPFIQLPTTISAGSHEQQIELTALPVGQTLHTLKLPSGVSEQSALASGHIILTGTMAQSLHVKTGDKITVSNQLGTHQLVVSGTVDEMLSSVAYVSLQEAQGWTGQSDSPINGAYLRVDPAKQDQVQTALYNLPGIASVQMKSTLRSDWTSLMGLFYALIGAILIFAVVMAFALLFNTMTVNVLERERELATMRAVGTGRRAIAMLLSTESVILWGLATVPGLIAGYLVARQMGSAFQSDLFSFSIVINPVTYVATAVGILLTMLLAALPAIRRVNRLNLAEATKVLS